MARAQDNAEFLNTRIGPGVRHFEIVPNDSTDLSIIPRAIYCAADGSIVIRDAEGTDLTYAMTAGDLLDFRAVRVMATGTSGTYYGWK